MPPETIDEFEAGFAAQAADRAPSLQSNTPADAPADSKDNGEQVEQIPSEAKPEATPPSNEPPAEEPESIESLRRQLAEANHRERSASSRISARDRQANAVAQENARLKAQLDALKAKAPAPSAPVQSSPDVLSEAAELEAAVNARVRQAMQPLEERLQSVTERATAAELAAEEAAGYVRPLAADSEAREIVSVQTHLDENFGGWRSEVSVKNERFHGWLASQPNAIKSLYHDGKTVADTSAVLTLYSAQTGHQFERKQAAQAPASAPRTASTSNLRNAIGLQPRPGITTARPDPNDFEGAFAEASSKLRK